MFPDLKDFEKYLFITFIWQLSIGNWYISFKKLKINSPNSNPATIKSTRKRYFSTSRRQITLVRK